MSIPIHKMNDETALREKLNMLQAQMLDFNKRISPVKGPLQKKESKKSISENLQITCWNIAINILKVIVTFIGPILFPSAIYYTEGCSSLFWEAMAISCFIIFAVITITFSILWNNAKKLKTYTSHISYCLKKVKEEITLKFISENASFKIFNQNKFLQIVCTSLFLSVVIATSWLVYGRYTPLLFYMFLTSIGFILRIIVVQIGDYLKDEKKLPLHNACKVTVNFVKSSPRAKRELNFSGMGKEKSLPFFISPSRPTALQEKNRKEIKTNHYLNADNFLTTPPPSYQEATRDSNNKQMFSNLKNFFYTP